MKIRIRGNSIRFRLTQSEVNQLCSEGKIEEITNLPSGNFHYKVEASRNSKIFADIVGNSIILSIPEQQLLGWESNGNVGFYQTQQLHDNKALELTLEKDFVCLDQRAEDESDNYPNPKAQLINEKIK